MYHISSDSRAVKSAEMIVDAALDLALSKKLDEITVSDIWRESSVSRSTFYRLFDNVSDVLQYSCDRLFQLSASAVPVSKGTRNSVLLFIKEAFKHKKLILALERNDRMDLLSSTIKHNFSAIMNTIGLGNCPPKEETYIVNILANCLCGGMNSWVQNGMLETPEELLMNFRKSFAIISTFLQ